MIQLQARGPHAWASDGFVPKGELVDFSKKISKGRTKVVKFVFFPLETKKTTFLLQISKATGAKFP